MHIQKQFSVSRRFVSFLSVVLVLTAVVGTAGLVHADQYEAQINALNNQNGQNQAAVNGLLNEAGSYEQAIGTLQSQINGLQAALNANLNRQADVQRQITEAQTKLDQQRNYLGENVKTMYIEGQLSTIEQLATSKTLSDYVDKEEYRTRVQNKIDSIIKQIAILQAELQKQKRELDVLVNTQREQNNQLVSARAQQQQLLAYNEGQRAAYTNQISANNGRIAELRRQQAAANARFTRNTPPGGGSVCGGGYPGVWCNAPMDSMLDTWGMYNRQCVSYTAFKVWQSGRYMPAWGLLGKGNAKQWDDNALAAGMSVDGNPRVGDVAVSNSGYYGHVMYVESVNANGTITISQYNADWTGRYSTATISPAGLNFIHFP